MKTIVKALSERKAIDGWGNEYVLRRPKMNPDNTYLAVIVNDNCSILRELIPQEILMLDVPKTYIEHNDFDNYKK
jgi:hypothetical protein